VKKLFLLQLTVAAVFTGLYAQNFTINGNTDTGTNNAWGTHIIYPTESCVMEPDAVGYATIDDGGGYSEILLELQDYTNFVAALIQWSFTMDRDIAYFLPTGSDSIIPFSMRANVLYDGFISDGAVDFELKAIASDNEGTIGSNLGAFNNGDYYSFDEFSIPGAATTPTFKMTVPTESSIFQSINFIQEFEISANTSHTAGTPSFNISADIEMLPEIVLPEQFFIDNPSIPFPATIAIGDFTVAQECIADISLKEDTLSAVIYSAKDIDVSSTIGHNRTTTISGENSVNLLSGFNMQSGSALIVNINPLSCIP